MVRITSRMYQHRKRKEDIKSKTLVRLEDTKTICVENIIGTKWSD